MDTPLESWYTGGGCLRKVWHLLTAPASGRDRRFLLKCVVSMKKIASPKTAQPELVASEVPALPSCKIPPRPSLTRCPGALSMLGWQTSSPRPRSYIAGWRLFSNTHRRSSGHGVSLKPKPKMHWTRSRFCCAHTPDMTFLCTKRAPSTGASNGVWACTRSATSTIMCDFCRRIRRNAIYSLRSS